MNGSEPARKKERGEKVTERGRQEGESGTQIEGGEERDRNEVAASRGVEPETKTFLVSILE